MNASDLIGRKFPVLDQGFVYLVDAMGDDSSVVQAARVSYGKGTRSVSDDRTLIRFLMRHRHETPFEMCLDGDTRIPTMPCPGATQKTYTIRQLARAFERGGQADSWAKLVKVRTVDRNSGLIVPTRIKRVWQSGVEPCYLVQSESPLGAMVVATDTHPFLCPDGYYRELGALRAGDEVMMNGKGVPHAYAHRIIELRTQGKSIGDIASEIGCSATGVYAKLPGELKSKVRRKTGFRKKAVGEYLDPHAIARSLIPSGGRCAVCGQTARERHHRDENPQNNDPANLLFLCVICHNAFHHGTVPLRVYPSRIRSIEPIGCRDVFDLEVNSPNHNFVAEHFVVHNCEIKLHVRVPMDVWRQWIRHRTANVNEYSTRYSEAIDANQTTPADRWRSQSTGNKQGSGDYLPAHANSGPCGEVLTARESTFHQAAREIYQERLDAGVAREQARKDLPLSSYTEAYWKCDLRNVLHFLGLRMDSHAQWEIRQYADVIGNQIIALLFPLCWEAFQDYRLHAVTLSRLDAEVIKRAVVSGEVTGHVLERLFVPEITESALENTFANTRERAECADKLRRLGLL